MHFLQPAKEVALQSYIEQDLAVNALDAYGIVHIVIVDPHTNELYILVSPLST